MVECNSHQTHNLNEQQQFRLNKINGIKYYFVEEIKKELMSKRLRKYLAFFDYFCLTSFALLSLFNCFICNKW